MAKEINENTNNPVSGADKAPVKGLNEEGLNTAKPSMGNTNSMDDKHLAEKDNKDRGGQSRQGTGGTNDRNNELAEDRKNVPGQRNGSDSNES